MATHLKKILGVGWIVTTLFLSGCNLLQSGEHKDAEIIHLKTALEIQQGSRAADLEFAERQAGTYLGCKQFFNLCSKETRELGEQRLKSGFAGTTSPWYWLGLLGEFTCIAFSTAVFIAMLTYLHLVVVAPKKERVEQAQCLIDGADDKARAVNRRSNEIEQRIGLMKKEVHELAATKRMLKKSTSVVERTENKLPTSTQQSIKQPEQDY
ncbi:hypothetical protein [Polaromonas sp. UC242_47]|uniref:hypothetical protein n=1 Tax=Polaromonas sp. UC242_47 TaxID=3374626 RepID=UPI00379C115F